MFPVQLPEWKALPGRFGWGPRCIMCIYGVRSKVLQCWTQVLHSMFRESGPLKHSMSALVFDQLADVRRVNWCEHIRTRYGLQSSDVCTEYSVAIDAKSQCHACSPRYLETSPAIRTSVNRYDRTACAASRLASLPVDPINHDVSILSGTRRRC